MEVGGAVAASGVGASIASCISRTSVLRVVPDVFVAGGDFLDAGGTVVDSEAEGVGAGTVVGVGVVVSEDTRRGVLCTIPQEGVASGRCSCIMSAIIHYQPQVHHAVACVKVERRVADSSIIGPSAPCQAVAGGQRV